MTTTAAAPIPSHAPAIRALASRATLRTLGVAGFAALTALAAQVSFPVPGTPVPVTLQTMTVTLAAAALGPRFGTLSMLLYLALGLIGLPVFADGAGGWRLAFGATGGYLLAFALVPALTAFALRARDGGFAGWRGLLAQTVLANAVIFTLGVVWLAFFIPLMPGEALAQGLYPFLPGTLVKGVMSVALASAIAPWAMRRVW